MSSAGILSNLPKKILNRLHQIVMDSISETSRSSLGRLRRDTVISSPLNLLLGTLGLLHRYNHKNNCTLTNWHTLCTHAGTDTDRHTDTRT